MGTMQIINLLFKSFELLNDLVSSCGGDGDGALVIQKSKFGLLDLETIADMFYRYIKENNKSEYCIEFHNPDFLITDKVNENFIITSDINVCCEFKVVINV